MPLYKFGLAVQVGSFVLSRASAAAAAPERGHDDAVASNLTPYNSQPVPPAVPSTQHLSPTTHRPLLNTLRRMHPRTPRAPFATLLRGLVANRAVKSLDLAANELDEYAGQELAHALLKNRTMTALDLTGNYLPEEWTRENHKVCACCPGKCVRERLSPGVPA